jgi:hypothetical protein
MADQVRAEHSITPVVDGMVLADWTCVKPKEVAAFQLGGEKLGSPTERRVVDLCSPNALASRGAGAETEAPLGGEATKALPMRSARTPTKDSDRPARPKRARGGSWLAPVVGFLLAAGAGGAVLSFAACGDDDEAPAPGRANAPGAGDVAQPPGATAAATATPSGPAPQASGAATAAPTSTAVVLAPDAPYDGPLLGAMAFQTPIYPEPRFSDERLGYIRQGGKVPVKNQPVIKKGNCKQGWYELVEGGFVCGKYATLDLEHARVKLGVKQPDLTALLPYQYAYNRFHGTPLYKTLPTRDEMLKYEPYLVKKEEDEKKPEPIVAEDDRRKGKHAAPESEGGAVPSGEIKAEDAVAAVEKLDTGAPEPEEAAAEAKEPKAWWQDEDKEKKPVVTLAELEQEADGNLSKRMVKGFFIAVDKTFGWNDRLWYRTTGGLLAPTDRMWVNKPPEAKGIEWPEGAKEIYFMLSEKGAK